MRTTADAVIIGGGAVGASILYHLTEKGMRDVVLLEKGALGSGSTGDSAAIVRQHYSNEVSIRLVLESLRNISAALGGVRPGRPVHSGGMAFPVPARSEGYVRRQYGQAQANGRAHAGKSPWRRPLSVLRGSIPRGSGV